MYPLGNRVNYVTSAMDALGTHVNYVTSTMYALETRVNYVTYATYANSNTPNPLYPRLLFRVPPQDNFLRYSMGAMYTDNKFNQKLSSHLANMFGKHDNSNSPCYLETA